MMRSSTARHLIPTALALVVGFQITPARLMAADPPSVPRDVAIGSDGSLRGVVVDPAGEPQASVPLWIETQGMWLPAGTTNADGTFQIAGLRGGVLRLATPSHLAVVRVWMPGTAPPGAAEAAVVVTESGVTRGQRPISELFFGDPVVVGLALAGAIAVPIIVANSKKSRAPGS